MPDLRELYQQVVADLASTRRDLAATALVRMGHRVGALDLDLGQTAFDRCAVIGDVEQIARA